MCDLLSQIQSAILSHTWQWDTKEKDKALVAKQEQLEQAHEHEQEMRKKQEEVTDTGLVPASHRVWAVITDTLVGSEVEREGERETETDRQTDLSLIHI